MVLITGGWNPEELLYDVNDPLHPRLLCTIRNTSAHLFTGDTFEYLKPVSANQTDVMLHSLGSGNESHAGSFPFYVASGSWLGDSSVMTYSVRPDISQQTMQVWLYAQRTNAVLYTYQIGIGDCVGCRFGLPPPVDSLSPDGQFIVAGWIAGKGSEPLAVYRVSDRTRVMTFDQIVYNAIWDRSGHRLFLSSFGLPAQSWTPEAGVASLTGAASWSFLPNVSPDGAQAAYTAYGDPDTSQRPRVYVYDLKGGATRMLVDQPRSQVLFVKDGWVWYLEELSYPANCRVTWPSGKVFAMQLSTGVEMVVSFAANDDPLSQGSQCQFSFQAGEFWPAS